MLRTHRRAWAEAGNKVRKAPPITIDILRTLIAYTPDDTIVSIRDRAALIFGFALIGWRSEIIGVDQHLTFVRAVLEVFIPMSKTDQDAVGATIVILCGSHLDTCPVRNVQAWQTVARMGCVPTAPPPWLMPTCPPAKSPTIRHAVTRVTTAHIGE